MKKQQIYFWESLLLVLYPDHQDFTLTSWSNCVSGRPPVSQRLGHVRSVCQLVDICLLPPPSVAMAAEPPLPPDFWLTMATKVPPLADQLTPSFSRVSSPQTPAVKHLCCPAVNLTLTTHWLYVFAYMNISWTKVHTKTDLFQFIKFKNSLLFYLLVLPLHQYYIK